MALRKLGGRTRKAEWRGAARLLILNSWCGKEVKRSALHGCISRAAAVPGTQTLEDIDTSEPSRGVSWPSAHKRPALEKASAAVTDLRIARAAHGRTVFVDVIFVHYLRHFQITRNLDLAPSLKSG